MAMVTAVETCPGTDPDRASFTTAMEAARDHLTAARSICPDGPADLPGAIGRAVLVKPNNMLTQLAEWTRLGFLTRTSAGTYALATPP